MGAPRRKQATAGVGLTAMLAGALLVVAPTSAAAHEPDSYLVDGKLTICHATNSDTTPYVKLAVAYDATDGSLGNGQNDHRSHEGGIWTPTSKANGEEWGDIIPPTEWDEDGYNWDLGHEILDNDCVVPGTGGTDDAVLVVTKDIPVEDAGEDTFGFKIGETDYGPIGDGQSFEAALAAATEVTVVETLDEDYDLTGVECERTRVVDDDVIEDDLTITFDGDAGSATISGGDIATGDIIDCTFTNEPVTESDPEATITIAKAAVTGTTIPATETFDFFGPFTGELPESASFQLAVGADSGGDTVDAGQPHTYVEAPDETYSLESVVCGDLVFEDKDPDDLQAQDVTSIVGVHDLDGSIRGVTITPVDGDDITCTFVNQGVAPVTPPDPQPLPASLQVVKVVADAPPGPWSFDFELVGATTDEDFELGSDDASESFTGLAAGSYTLTERRPDGDLSTLTDVTCRDGDDELALTGSEDTRTVDLAAGADVICTFTNTYPEVQDTTVTVPPTTVPPTTAPPTTTPPTTEAPVAEPTEEVAGETVVRTLPRTGNEARDLAGFGAALLALGAALVLASNRRLGSIS